MKLIALNGQDLHPDQEGHVHFILSLPQQQQQRVVYDQNKLCANLAAASYVLIPRVWPCSSQNSILIVRRFCSNAQAAATLVPEVSCEGSEKTMRMADLRSQNLSFTISNNVELGNSAVRCQSNFCICAIRISTPMLRDGFLVLNASRQSHIGPTQTRPLQIQARPEDASPVTFP